MMNNFNHIPLVHSKVRYLGVTWITLLVLLGLLVMGSNEFRQSTSLIWFGLLLCGIFILGSSFANSAAQAARVFSSGVMPQALWKKWLYKVLHQIALYGFAAVFLSIVLLSLSGHIWAWRVVPALLSICLFISMMMTFIMNQLFHKRFLIYIFAIIIVLLMPLLTNQSDIWLNANWLWYLLFWFVSPLFFLVLIRKWENPPKKITQNTFADFKKIRFIFSYFKRFTSLNLAIYQKQKTPLTVHYFVPAIVSLLVVFGPLNLSFGLLSFDETINFSHICLVIAIAIFSIQFVICKDLHWRFLLAPKGFSKGNIGWHIFKYSFIHLGGLMSLTYICFQLMNKPFAQIGTVEFLVSSLKHSLSLLELATAISCSVLILASKNIGRTFLIFCVVNIAFVLITLFPLVMIYGLKTNTPLFQADIKYGLFLSVILVSNIGIANRRWTVQKLLRFYKQ